MSKKQPNFPGIYRIDTPLGAYVGQAKNISSRWKQHLRELEDGSHCNDGLLRAYRQYGRKRLKFSVLERCSVANLDRQEAIYIRRFGKLNETRPRLRWHWFVMPWELCPPLWGAMLTVSGLVLIGLSR